MVSPNSTIDDEEFKILFVFFVMKLRGKDALNLEELTNLLNGGIHEEIDKLSDDQLLPLLEILVNRWGDQVPF